MYIDEMDSCCSVSVINEMWEKDLTAEHIKAEMVNSILDYTDRRRGVLEKEYPTYFVATTNNTQPDADKALKEVGFVGRKFYGRHQAAREKREKYMTFWTLSKVPADVMRRARAKARDMKSNSRW